MSIASNRELQPEVPSRQSAGLGTKISLDGLSKRFPQSTPRLFTREWREGRLALQNVSLAVRENSFVSVVGPSGCGKTTLLRMVAGLIQPTSGQVRIDGQAITSPRPGSSMVFQYIGLFPWRTIEENVFFSQETRLHRSLTAEEKDRARHFLSLVGLRGFEKNYPHQLSGGMQQRVGIARALATEPDVLLMDEPFGALDAQTRLILQDELIRICGEYRATVLFITHDIEEAIYLSDQVVVLSRRPGQIKMNVEIDLPRPRNDEIRSLARFTELRNLIWHGLREEMEELDG